MRFVATLIAGLAFGTGSVSATLAPGAPTVPLPPTPDFLFLPGVQTALPFAVQAGELVLLRSGATDTSSANWLAVLSFGDTTGSDLHGVATLYVQSNWVGFVLDPGRTGNVLYETDSGTSSQAIYAPASEYGFGGSSPVTYSFDPPVYVPVPEPSTFMAAALLLLPVGLNAFRIVRKYRVAQS
jgi:hypothetical protein